MVEAPALAKAVQGRFEAHLHHVMATLRRDGAPRVSGTEVAFRGDDLWVGSMWQAVKAQDLRADPRVALHSAPIDPTMADGDAKVAGRAVEVTAPDEIESWVQGGPEERRPPPGPFHLFRLDVEEVVLVTVTEDHLVVDSWTPAGGLRRVDRT